ncbi:MAG: ChaN family lipoprotein [Thermodesulfovibrionales bacterium]
MFLLLFSADPSAASEHFIEFPEKGIKITLENQKILYRDGIFEVSFELVQKKAETKTEWLELEIPIKFYTLKGDVSETLKLEKEKQSFQIRLEDEPLRMVIDEDLKLPRKHSEEEIAPNISMLFRGKTSVILPESGRDHYKPLIEFFKERGLEIKEPTERVDLKGSLILFGNNNPVAKGLFGSVKDIFADFSITVKKNPWNPESAVGIINIKDPLMVALTDEDFSYIKEILIQYQDYSTIAIKERKIILKELEVAKRGLEIELRRPVRIIEPKKSLSIKDLIDRISDKKIIYIGEYHDRFSHHYLQRLLIKELFSKNKKIAIGMEMFQRPFQQILDDYIKGKIEEKEFLKQTEYFKRWGFDYNLYKPIIDLAREYSIPVIALNLKKEITEKVSRSGIESLSEEEKKQIPEELDFSDQEYKKRLEEVFRQHKRPEGSFEYFYQSQILWDETMAMSIDEYLRKAPDYQIIVLAGGGHIAFGSGIPKRVFRRNSLDYVIVLIDAEDEESIADFVIYPDSLEGVTAPKLMVSLKEEAGRLRIIEMPEESPSKRAGIKKNDIIIKIDDIPVSTLEDLKIALFYKKSGDTVKVTVLRRYFLLGEKEREFFVKF